MQSLRFQPLVAVLVLLCLDSCDNPPPRIGQTGLGNAASGGPAGPAGGSSARSGYATGTAVFEDGTPIPQFKVRVAGLLNIVDGVGENGQFSFPLKTQDALICTCTAKTTLDYHGKKYTLPLWPKDNLADDGRSNGFRQETDKGITRDLVLKMSGPMSPYDEKSAPESDRTSDRTARYGGSITLDWSQGSTAEDFNGGLKTGLSHRYPAGSIITLTLDPTDKRVDDLPGTKIERTMDASISTGINEFGIPLCAYNATATLKEPNGTVHPLRISLTATAITDFTPSVALECEPWGDEGEYLKAARLYFIDGQ